MSYATYSIPEFLTRPILVSEGNLGTRNWYFISDESVFAGLNEFLFYISGFVLYFSLVLGFYIL